MYCLRTFLPLLLLPLPLSLSPVHLTALLILTYILNRPCIYCSFLLIILFGSSCAWQGGRCFWSADSTSSTYAGNGTVPGGVVEYGWAAYFLPRLYTTPATLPSQASIHSSTSENAMAAFLAEITNHTLSGLATAARESGSAILGEVKRKLVGGSAQVATEAGSQSISSLGSGIGTHWLKNLLGRSEWTLPCVGVKVAI